MGAALWHKLTTPPISEVILVLAIIQSLAVMIGWRR